MIFLTLLNWKIESNKDSRVLILPKVIIAILKPIPGLPNKLSLGISQSSKIKLQVEDPRIPNLSSFFPSDRPTNKHSLKTSILVFFVTKHSQKFRFIDANNCSCHL